jgi:hypothetical protein
MVYESFVHATLVYNNYGCGADDRCFLIVFSDLKDSRYPTPDYLVDKINLTGVNIVSVMFNCDPIFQPSCKSVQDQWAENFVAYHANTPPKYINGINIEKTLNDILKRR